MLCGSVEFFGSWNPTGRGKADKGSFCAFVSREELVQLCGISFRRVLYKPQRFVSSVSAYQSEFQSISEFIRLLSALHVSVYLLELRYFSDCQAVFTVLNSILVECNSNLEKCDGDTLKGGNCCRHKMEVVLYSLLACHVVWFMATYLKHVGNCLE